MIDNIRNKKQYSDKIEAYLEVENILKIEDFKEILSDNSLKEIHRVVIEYLTLIVQNSELTDKSDAEIKNYRKIILNYFRGKTNEFK